MPLTEKLRNLIRDLPDADAARRFYERFAEKNPSQTRILDKSPGLLSDVLTLAGFSPLLSTTLLQHPEYAAWLSKQRASAKVRDREEILESLARFALTNSQIETHTLLARFRRRELLRIYLQDIRNLETIAEVTEEISNLADAILEHALRIARQEMDNRYGIPLETDENERAVPARFCIVALGKLGSKELNYASDIDLLFLYSADGATSGTGTRGTVTNQEYFIKLSEYIVKLVGAQTGEGAAYRVDVRLRPNGRVGALAISCKEAVRYYRESAQDWERQVLIRSRAAAGDADVFRNFFQAVESCVFSADETIENALESVSRSKQKINLEKAERSGFNVKLGRGGIREIEFIAQALQLAYGGTDEWLRAPHTLISLARLADRDLLTETELTELSDAYAFLRRLEHRLQMENGLQTHLVPENAEKRELIARRMNFKTPDELGIAISAHTNSVSRIFSRVFGTESNFRKRRKRSKHVEDTTGDGGGSGRSIQPIISSLEKSEVGADIERERISTIEKISAVSPHFAQIIQANPALVSELPHLAGQMPPRDYAGSLRSAIGAEASFARRLAALRRVWAKHLIEIVVFDIFEKLEQREAKRLQTRLAEAAIEIAVEITRAEMDNRFGAPLEKFPFAVLGLGKLGSGSLDYDSDLDLVLVYDDESPVPFTGVSHAEFYSRAVSVFVETLSGFTREGHLYRVDLRLRPDGKNGATSSGKKAFFEYLRKRSAIWEWLAYVKLRAVGGDLDLARAVETKARAVIHENARRKVDHEALRTETLHVRERLETEKTKSRKTGEIDIKFGEGGMLDVYFAVRYLQLRDELPDAGENRSTFAALENLRDRNALGSEDFRNLYEGYRFLSRLDHNLRLTVGRSTRLPLANQNALQTIRRRMDLGSVNELLENLSLHRINIRQSFENILEV